MSERCGKPIGDLVRCCNLEDPLPFPGSGATGVCTAAETNHAVGAVQLERSVLRLPVPFADSVQMQGEDVGSQGLDVAAFSSLDGDGNVLLDDKAAAVVGDRDDLLVARTAGGDKLQSWIFMKRFVDVSRCGVRGEG